MDIRAQSAVTTVVTLIHGTFARGALWTQEESTLCKELTRHLGSVTFRSFEWTGANSHNARIAAGVLLGKHVLNVKAEFPEARHILIAHSHGGNVIFYSLRDMKVREAICGVVTMGTPFIRCDLRPEHTVVGVVRYLAAALTFAISFVFFATEYEYIKSGDLGTTENWMIVATATLLAVAVWSFLYKPARRWFTRAANRVLIRLQPSSVKVPCLVVHTAGDEAGLLLRTARYVATAPFVLSNVVLGILPAIFGTALLLVGLGEVAGSITELGRQLASDAWFITAICAILMFLSLIAIPIGMAAIPTVARGHPLAFGWERIIDNLTADIATSLHPRKEKHRLDEAFQFSSKFQWGKLRHSSMYQDPIVMEHIAKWVARLTPPTADDLMPAQDTREEPTKHLKNISRLRLACVVAVVLVLIIVWANGLLDAAYRTYADPDWRTQLQKSPEQLIYSEQLADVHSRVSGTNSWILPIHIPAKGNCRISGFYVSDRYSLNLNVQSDTNFQDLFNGKRRSFTLEVESMEVMEPLEGRRRTSFDVHVPPGKRQLRLWIFHFLEGMATNFHLRANLNCWSGDVAFASQTWFQRIASLDLSPLGLPYPLW